MKLSKFNARIGLIITLLGSLIEPAAGDFSISPSYTLLGGGSISGGEFSIDAVIGETDASEAIGGGFALLGGHLPWTQILDTSPQMFIARRGMVLTLMWPLSASNYRLQTRSRLEETPWSSGAIAPEIQGSFYVATVPVTEQLQFFRLIRP